MFIFVHVRNRVAPQSVMGASRGICMPSSEYHREQAKILAGLALSDPTRAEWYKLAAMEHLERVARDHWVETLTCRRCGRIGVAHLSTDDRLSWTVEVHGVSEGFKVIQSENGSNFYCSSCDRPVEP
jgi:hypothetical protein